MKWILGLDLRPHSRGALRFGAWAAGAATPQSFLPVHVLEEEHLLVLLHHHHLDEVLADARLAAERALETERCVAAFEDVRLVQGRWADEALADLAAAERADAIVVGRVAKRGTHPVVRLGRVARRLVRHLPATLVVVPPDLVAVGAGPVVALTSLDADSRAACRFARDFASAMSRPLAVLHVLRDPAGAAAYGLPEAAIERHRSDALSAGRAALGAWLAEADLHAERAELLVGDVVEQALAFSEAHDAPLVVTGARRRHSIQRLYAPSVGRELAAAAPRAVAIVAPRDEV